MADFNSKYTGAEVEAKLDNIPDIYLVPYDYAGGSVNAENPYVTKEYVDTEIMNAFNSQTGASDSSALSYYNVVNDNVVDGRWVCPKNWDDPYNGRGTPVNRDEQVLYLVYLAKPTAIYAFHCNVAYKVEIGHFNKSEFVAISSNNYNANEVCRGALENDKETSGKDTFVLRITSSSNITSFIGDSASFNGATIAWGLQPCVIRYGNMPNLTNLATIQTSCAVEDIINHKVSYNNYNEAYSLVKVRVTGIKVTRIFFAGLYLVDHDFENLDTSNITDMSGMFSNCPQLKNLDVSNWDTSKVTTMSGMFENCYNLQEIKGIENFRLPNCKNFYRMFALCNSLKGEIDLSGWNVNAATNLAGMFAACYNITGVNMSNWSFSPSANMSIIFQSCRNLKWANAIEASISSPDDAGGINANAAFQGCNSIVDIEGFEQLFSHVYHWTDTFNACWSLKSIDFSSVSLRATSSASSILLRICQDCRSIEYLDLSSMDLDNYTSGSSQIGDMIKNCFKLADFFPPQNIGWGINLSSSRFLTHESLMSVINNLTAPKGTTDAQKTLTLGGTNLSKLTDSEKEVATNKGWILA